LADKTDGIEKVLAWARARGQPEAERASGAVAALAASASSLRPPQVLLPRRPDPE